MTEDKKLSEIVAGAAVANATYGLHSNWFKTVADEIADLEQQNADLQRRLDKWNRGHNSLHARNADEKIADLEKRLAEAEEDIQYLKKVNKMHSDMISHGGAS